jgi:hypothetical protein
MRIATGFWAVLQRNTRSCRSITDSDCETSAHARENMRQSTTLSQVEGNWSFTGWRVHRHRHAYRHASEAEN